jgi:hypothetical protein
MYRGRLVGGLIGVVMLVTVLTLPFSNVASAAGQPPDSLWNIFISYINNLGSVPNSQGTALINFAVLYQVTAILIVIAALVGIYPAGSGVLGVIGLSFATFGPYEVMPDYGSNPSVFGSGFFLLWGASIVQLGVGYWTFRGERRAKKEKARAEVDLMEPKGQSAGPKEGAKGQVRPSKGPGTANAQIVCPTCGTVNPASAAVCKKCAAPL